MPLSSHYQRFMQSWRFHSRLEQILIGATTITSFLVLLFLILLIHQHKTLENYCRTPTCLMEAAKIVERIDSNINPCKDFYKFACGNYIKNENEDLSSLLYKKVKHQTYELFFEPIQEEEHLMVRSQKKLFQTCMDTRPIQADNLTTIKKVLTSLGGWPVLEGPQWDETKFDWLETTYKLRKLGYPFEIFLDLLLSVDPQNWTKHMLEISLPDYETTDQSNRKEEMLKEVLKFGADSSVASKDVDEMYNFEHKLSQHHTSQPKPFTVKEFQNKIGDINWLNFINNLSGPAAQISPNEVVRFPEQEEIRKRLDVISTVSKRTQANFLLWKMIQKTLPYISPPYQTGKSRADYCLDLVQESFFPYPLSVMYARKYVPATKKKYLEELVQNLKNKLIKSLDNIEWLDKNDKQKLRSKLQGITVVIGMHGDYLSDKLLDDMNIDMGNISNASFLNLLSQAKRNYKSEIYSRIRKDKSEIWLHHRHNWFAIPHLTLYSKDFNILHVSAIAIQNMVFNENRPSYLNYGVLGTQIAKHLSSIIMNTKIKKDHALFHNNVLAQFENITKCTVTNLQSNGMASHNFLATSVPENILAPQLSYETYSDWVKSNGEEPKLIDTEYTQEQLFWILTVSCQPGYLFDVGSKFLQDYPKLYSQLMNSCLGYQPKFASDFNCPTGSLMNPPRKCDIF